MDVSINDDCTLQATIDGVFGQLGPVIVNATYRDGNSTIVDIVGHPVFGDATITVADDGALTLTGTGLHQGIESVAATGTVTTTQISLEVTLTFVGGSMATETVELTRDVADTPTPTPTPAPTDTPVPTDTPTPTPTAPPGQQVTWADSNCKDGVNPVDSLLVLRGDAGLSANTNECPPMGASIEVLNASQHTWGDVDCKDGMTPVDSLKILRYDAGLSVSQEAGCPAMASMVTITEL